MAVSMTTQADHSLAAALLVVITAIALSNVNGVLAEAIFAVMALAAMSAAKANRLSNAAWLPYLPTAHRRAETAKATPRG